MICVNVQFVLMYPAWILSLIPAVFIISLHYTYRNARPEPAIMQQPEPLTLMRALVIGKPDPPPITVKPDKSLLVEEKTMLGTAMKKVDSWGDKMANAFNIDFDKMGDKAYHAVENFSVTKTLVKATNTVVDATGAVVGGVAGAAKVAGGTVVKAAKKTGGAVVDVAHVVGDIYEDATDDDGIDAFSVAMHMGLVAEEAEAKKEKQVKALREAFAQVQQEVDDAIEDAVDNDHDDDSTLTQRLLIKAGHATEEEIEAMNKKKEDEKAEKEKHKLRLPGTTLVKNQVAKAGDFLGITHNDDDESPQAKGIGANMKKTLNVINPLVSYLHPVQQKMGTYLKITRFARRLFTWRDKRLTLVLYIGLWLLAFALFLIMRFLPWHIIGPWLVALLAFAGTGPHMYFLGVYWRRKTQKEIDLAVRFDEADATGKSEILEEKRDELMKKAIAKIKKTLDKQAKKSVLDRQKAEYYGHNKVKFIVRSGLVSTEKQIMEPDPGRSRAMPMERFMKVVKHPNLKDPHHGDENGSEPHKVSEDAKTAAPDSKTSSTDTKKAAVPPAAAAVQHSAQQAKELV